MFLENGEWHLTKYPNKTTLQEHHSSDNVTKFFIGTILQATCDEGYSPSNPNTTIECLPTMQWSASNSLKCEVTKCPALSVENGFVDGDVDAYKSSIRVYCDRGYRLQSEGDIDYQILFCQPNGTWNDSVPVCDIVNCPEPLEVENASYKSNGSLEGEFTFNSTVSYSCNTGFSQVSGDRLMQCSETGVWLLNELPICKPVLCRHPGKVQHGQVYGRTSEVFILI